MSTRIDIEVDVQDIDDGERNRLTEATGSDGGDA